MIRRTDLLNAHPAEISKHLRSKGIASTIREDAAGYDIEATDATTNAQLTTALADFVATKTKALYQADIDEAQRRGLDRDTYVGMLADLVTIRAYINLANPTTAQTVANGKATDRILRVLVRD